jgi:hypothetical protein
MHDLWASLNQRQRSYLQALYKCDQASEYDRKERGCAVVEAAHPPAFGVGSSMAPPSRQANSTACCAKPSWSTKAPARPGKHWKLAASCSVAAFPTTSACPCSKSSSPLQAANSCARPPANSAPKLPPKANFARANGPPSLGSTALAPLASEATPCWRSSTGPALSCGCATTDPKP